MNELQEAYKNFCKVADKLQKTLDEEVKKLKDLFDAYDKFYDNEENRETGN